MFTATDERLSTRFTSLLAKYRKKKGKVIALFLYCICGLLKNLPNLNILTCKNGYDLHQG